MKVHLRMLGCRLNQGEIDRMARQFQQQGHVIVLSPEEADLCIVNTCAVTNEATVSSRKLVRELHRANPSARITVTGCYAQIAPGDIAVLPGVDRVVDNTGKDTLVEQITGVSVETFDHEPIARDAQAGAMGRTRAFIKVQDGCDNACTFCITAVARGDGHSRPAADVIDEIRGLHAAGYMEVVLTGVHLGSYGHDTGDQDGLLHLVRTVLNETDVPRVRLSSLEPWDLSAGFFDLWQNPRVCPHLHLPLQSGCDATLKRMRRNTDQASFRALVRAARERIPNVSITSDVIAGFPGETGGEFEASTGFIEEMAFAGMHIFRYSKRPGTPAVRMRGHVNEAVKKARSARLHELAARMEADFAGSLIGQRAPVLWEQVSGATEEGFVNIGYTDNYVRARAVYPRALTNAITDSTITGYDAARRQLTVTPVLEPVVME